MLGWQGIVFEVSYRRFGLVVLCFKDWSLQSNFCLANFFFVATNFLAKNLFCKKKKKIQNFFFFFN